MSNFLGSHDIVSCFVPVDTQGGANTGDWVSLKNYSSVVFVLFKDNGVANDDPVLTFEQATDVAGTGHKALNVTRHLQKQGLLLSAVGTWTEVTQAAGTSITLNATSAEHEGIYVVEVDASELDLANGFDCVQLSVADTGAAGAQLGCAFYILCGARYATELGISAIVD